MTLPASHVTHPLTLLTLSHSCSTFRMPSIFRDGTDRWFSGPKRQSGSRNSSVGGCWRPAA